MKKIIKRIIIIFLITIFIEFLFYLFKTHHDFEYNITIEDKSFEISETYNKNKYYFNIKVADYNFSFVYDNKFYKSKKVIDSFEYYEQDDMLCLYPILEKDNYFNIICSKNDELYYYDYLKDDLQDFANSLIDNGYSIPSFDETPSKTLGSTRIYQENIAEDSYIYVWKYNGFYTLSREKLEQLNIFKKDTYLNNLGINIDRYYLVPNYDEDYEYNSMFIFDMKNNKRRTLTLKDGIDNDYYINGVVNNKLYIFDEDNLVQYEINLKRNKYKIVGEKDSGGLFYNGEWETRNIYDFKTEELIFEVKEKDSTLEAYDNVLNYEDNYYYLDGDNLMLYNSYLKTTVYLLKISNIVDLKVVADDIYFIKDNSLYYYNNYVGLKKIMEYEELTFNRVNRYAVYKK